MEITDKIQHAYHDSKNIYDDVLTQRSFLSSLYIKLFWGETDDNEIAKKGGSLRHSRLNAI